MTLLNPWMLLGLAGLAGPLVLHLINRHRYPVEEFPAIQLLRVERRANRFARRLVDIPQLLLRLLVLLLMVLAMARFFWPVVPTAAPHNLVVVVDGAARMSAAPGRGEDPRADTLFEQARGLARTLLDGVPAPGLGALILTGDTAHVVRPLMRGPEAAAGVEELTLSDGAGDGLIASLAKAAELIEGRREAHGRIVVLSDLNAVAFAHRNPDDLARLRRIADRLGDRLEVVFVDMASGAPVENVTLIDALVRGGDVLLGDDARILARVMDRREPPDEPDAPAPVLPIHLSLPGIREPFVRHVTLERDVETVVELTGRMTRAVRGFGAVAVDVDDDVPLDNTRQIPLVVRDARHILIVREPPPTRDTRAPRGDFDAAAYAGPDGPTVLRFALNPGREMGRAFSTGMDTQVVTPDALAAQPLGRYAAVVLYGISSLPEASLRDLRAFVRDGRALLVIAGDAVNPLMFNRTMTARGDDDEALLPFPIGAMQELETPLAVDRSRLEHPVTAGLDDAARHALDMIRVARLRALPASDTETAAPRVVLQSATGLPLIVESTIGRGRVLTWLFGLESDDGNLPRTRIFPRLVWRLLDYATGRLDLPEPERLLAGRPVVLDVSEPEFAFVDELELSRQALPGAPDSDPAEAVRRYRIRDDRTVALDPLPAGRYLLHRPRPPGEPDAMLAYARPLAVNIDAAYASSGPMSSDALAALFGPVASTATAATVSVGAPRGAEGWMLLAALALLAYLVEGVLAHRAGLRRAAHPDAGEAAT